MLSTYSVFGLRRVEPVFKATDLQTGRAGVVVMGIIDQLYHPGEPR